MYLQPRDSNSGVLVPSPMFCPSTSPPAQTPSTLPTTEVAPVICITLPPLTPILLASILVQLKGRNPAVGGLGFGGTESPGSGSTYLFRVRANLDGIGNEAGCFFFSHGADVFQTNGQLASAQKQRMRNKQEEAY